MNGQESANYPQSEPERALECREGEGFQSYLGEERPDPGGEWRFDLLVDGKLVQRTIKMPGRKF